ncbi:hypothetical protein BCR33DRAFT_723390, partial [Rhizoclosmatium globosum]
MHGHGIYVFFWRTEDVEDNSQSDSTKLLNDVEKVSDNSLRNYSVFLRVLEVKARITLV